MHPDIKQTLDDLRAAYSSRDVDLARQLAQQILGTSHDPTACAAAHEILGRVAWDAGKGAESCAAFNAALTSVDHSPDVAPQDLVRILDLAALGEFYFGSEARATALRRRALALAQTALPDDLAQLRRLRRRLAASLADEGRLSEAETLYLAAAPLAEDPADERVSWNTSVALFCEAKADLGTALAHYRAIAEILETEPDAVGFVPALANLCHTLLDLNRPLEVAPVLRKMRKALRSDDKFASQIAVLDVRVACLAARGRAAAAIRLGERALALVEQEAGAGHRKALARAAHLEKALRAAGRTKEADALIARTLANAPEDAAAAELHVAAARAHLADKNHAKAEDNLIAALGAAAHQNHAETLSEAFRIAADLAAQQGNTPAAAFLGKLAISIIRTTLATLEPEDADSWLESRQAAYNTVLGRLAAIGRVGEASRLLLRNLQEESLSPVRGDLGTVTLADVPFLTDERMWWRHLEQVLDAKKVSYRDTTKEISAWLAGVLSATNTRAPGDAELDAPWPNGAIAPGSAVLSALLAQDTLTLHLQTERHSIYKLIPVDQTRLGDAALRLRTALEFRERGWRAVCEELHGYLIAPIVEELAGIARLHVLTHGVLGFVPFAALYDGRHHLVEQMDVAYLTGQICDRAPVMRAPKAIGFSATQFAGPLPALSGQRELAAIARHLGGAAHLGPEFTAPRLLAALNGAAEVIHLATHFVHDPVAPKKSVLHLGDGSEFSLLRIAEPDVDLSSVELLVLAACETAVADGIGPTQGRRAQSLAGLAQAKGARQIVGSLWQVPDGDTGQLMEAFYAGYAPQDGRDAAAALGAAQRAMLGRPAAPEGAAPRGIGSAPEPIATPHPGTWAGFGAFVS